MNTPLLTDSQASSGQIQVNAINNTLARHAAKGIDAHDDEGVVSYLFADSGGNSLSPFSLVIGGAQANTGNPQKVYLPVAQNPQSTPTTANLLVRIYGLIANEYINPSNPSLGYRPDTTKRIPGRYYAHEFATSGDGPGIHVNPQASFIDLRKTFSVSEANFGYSWLPIGGVPYIALITGDIIVETSGNYNFYLNSDDASWLYIDGNLIIDNSWADGWNGWEHGFGVWTQNGVVSNQKTVYLNAGTYSIRIVNQQDTVGSGLIFNLPAGITYGTLVPTGLDPFESYQSASNTFSFQGILFTNQDEMEAGMASLILEIQNSTLTADTKTAIITQLSIQPFEDTDRVYSVVVNAVTYRFGVTIISSTGFISVVYNP